MSVFQVTSDKLPVYARGGATVRVTNNGPGTLYASSDFDFKPSTAEHTLGVGEQVVVPPGGDLWVMSSGDATYIDVTRPAQTFDDFEQNLTDMTAGQVPGLSAGGALVPLSVISASALPGGSGSPEGVVTADPGTIYRDSTGTFWSKATGTGNTGWSPQLPVGYVRLDAQAGSTDKARMQAAATAVSALGGAIIFERKDYQVDLTGDSAPLFDFGANVRVRFVGVATGNVTATRVGTTTIRRTGGTQPLLRVQGTGDTGTTRGHVGADNIEFNGGGTSGDVVVLYRCSEVDFTNVRIKDATGIGLHATQLWNSTFTGCKFYALGSGTSAPATLFDALAGDTTQGASQTVQFSTCQWEANTGTDLRLTGSRTDSCPSFGFTFNGVKFERQVAGAAYPVLDLDYCYRVEFTGYDISAGGTGTTSPLVTNAADSWNNVNGGIHFTGGAFSHTGSAPFYMDLFAGHFNVSATSFLGTPTTTYVRLGSAMTATSWRHDASVRFQDITKDFTDGRSSVVTAGTAMRRIPIDNKSSGVTTVTVGWVVMHSLPDAATERVTGILRVPEDYEPGSTLRLRVSWTSPTISGNARLRVEYLNVASSTNLASATASTDTQTVAAPTTANGIKFTDFSLGTAFTPAGLVPWALSRIGADAADTLADVVDVASIDMTYRRRGS